MSTLGASDRARFAEHASPEAIFAHLVDATKEARAWAVYAEWLAELAVTRSGQVARGEWPARTQDINAATTGDTDD